MSQARTCCEQPPGWYSKLNNDESLGPTGQMRRKMVQNNRSKGLNLGSGCLRLNTASRCRRAKSPRRYRADAEDGSHCVQDCRNEFKHES